MAPLSSHQAYTCALRLLGRRAFSVRELANKLRRREVEEEVVQEVVDRLKQEGWLDDAAYARAYVHDRLLFHPAGRRTLKLELLRRGVDSDLADAALSNLGQAAEEDLVRRLAAKRRRRGGAPEPAEVERLRRWLLGRGFSYSTVAKVVGSSQDDEELADEEAQRPENP